MYHKTRFGKSGHLASYTVYATTITYHEKRWELEYVICGLVHINATMLIYKHVGNYLDHVAIHHDLLKGQAVHPSLPLS